MKLPLLSPELVWKLDNVHTLFDLDRLGGLARLEGNPFRIEIQKFGRATAFTSPVINDTYYNKLLGFGAPDTEMLPLIASYVMAKAAPTLRVDLLPNEIDETVADSLTSFGLRHVDFQAGFYGLPEIGDIPPPPGVSIQNVDSDADLDLFLELFHGGWDMEAATLPTFQKTMRYWKDLPGWHLYLACLDGVARGIGIMFITEEVAYMAVAATLPDFRGRGCEKMLLHHAIRRAKELGCAIIFGTCDATSPTARNYDRMGLKLAYHKAIWKLRGGGS